MTLEEGLMDIIEDNVAGLSGAVFPSIAPKEQALPYATYQVLNIVRNKDLDGYFEGGHTDFQINFFSSSYGGAQTLHSLFINYIQNYRSTIGDKTIQDVEILYEQDDSEPVGGLIRFKRIVDIRFRY